MARQNPWAGFRASRADACLEVMPRNTTFVMSVSAMENFEEDVTFFDQLRQFALRQPGPLLQVHLTLPAEGLRLYPLHGVRQYTPRKLSIITRLFCQPTHKVLYRLGGERCNALHYKFITKPIHCDNRGDLRGTQSIEYQEGLYRAIEQDMEEPGRETAFYALLLHTHPRKRVFGSNGPLGLPEE